MYLLRRGSLLIFLSVLVSCAKPCDSLTAYEVLEEYGFPIGLLPTNVENYTLDSSDGSFVVYLSSSCKFTVSSYTLKYSKKFTGKISTDLLRNLSGIKVKVWFFYLSITKVVREGEKLKFYVGSLSATFPVSNFAVCPQCGCGLDCVGLGLPLSNSLVGDT